MSGAIPKPGFAPNESPLPLSLTAARLSAANDLARPVTRSDKLREARTPVLQLAGLVVEIRCLSCAKLRPARVSEAVELIGKHVDRYFAAFQRTMG